MSQTEEKSSSEEKELELTLRIEDSQELSESQESTQYTQDSQQIPFTQKYGLKDTILADLKCKVYSDTEDSVDMEFGDNHVTEVKTEHEESLELSEEESGEEDIDELVSAIEERMKERKILVGQVRSIDKAIEDNRVRTGGKELRMKTKEKEKEELQSLVEEQEKELEDGKGWEKEIDIDMKRIQKLTKDLEDDMIRTKINGARLLGGGQRGFRVKTMEVIAGSGKSISIFHPGTQAWGEQPREIKEDSVKATNLVVNSYGKSLSEAAGCIKEYEPKEGKEKEIMIIIINWGRLLEIRGEALTKIEVKKIMGMLGLAVNRGKSKATQVIIGIPPMANGGNKKEMELLVEEATKKYKGVDENISVLLKTEEAVTEPKEDENKDACEDAPDEVNPSFLRFCLSTLATDMSNIKLNICKKCDLLHEEKEECAVGDTEQMPSGSGLE